MKRRSVSFAAILVTLGVLATGQQALARTWTDTQGRKVEAEFAGVRDGRVQLKTESGAIRSVPVEQLSSEDRRFVAEAIGVKPAAPAAAAQPDEPKGAPANAGEENDRFSEAIRQNPNSADAYYQRGLSRLNRSQAKDALADFEQAVKLDPNSAEAYDGRGQAHAAAGNPVAAAEDFDRALGLNPNLAAAYQHRGDNLKALANSEAGRELFDKKVEDYRKMYDAARQKQLNSKAWQPLNSTSGPSSRLAMVNQMAKLDYDMARKMEANQRAGKSSPGYGSGKGPGPGKPPAVAKQPPIKPEKPEEPPSAPPSPPESESGVVVIPEKVPQGENVVLVADPDKLAAGLAHEAQAVPEGKQPKYGEGEGAKTGESPKSNSKSATGAKPDMPKAVDFYRDKDGDGKLDTAKDELLASDAEPQDGYSAEVSTANFPVGKQKYFAVPKVKSEDSTTAVNEPGNNSAQPKDASLAAASDSQKEKPANGDPSESSDASPDEKKEGESSKPDDEYQAAEPTAVASAAVSGTGEVVDPEKEEKPEQVASADKPKKSPKKSPKKGSGGGGGGKGYGGPGGGGYAGPRNPDAARAIERALGYADRNEYGPAIKEYDDLLTDYVDDPYYLSGRAGVHLAQGGYDLAIRDYDRVIEVGTPTAEIYYNRGCAHLSVGNLAAAIADFSASLKLDELGQFANLALNNRGAAYARSGELERAVADFEAAIQLNPNDATAYRNRSLALRKLGKTAEADADLTKSQQLGAGA